VSGAPAPARRALSADAEVAIRRLAAAYGVAVVTHDTDLWMSLWAPSEKSSADPLTLDLHWAQRIAQRWESLGTTVLHVTTHLIEPCDEDHARGTVFCLAELDRPRDVFVRQSLVYDDRYVLSAGEWRFSTRRHLLWYGHESVDPRRCAPAEWPSAQVGRGVDICEHLRASRAPIGGDRG
jgi:hypothetical protein